MSEVLAKDIPLEQQFMTDYWKFRKQYYYPENSDKYWKSVCSSADELYQKYNKNDYFKNLIIACVNDFENRFRKGEKGE